MTSASPISGQACPCGSGKERARCCGDTAPAGSLPDACTPRWMQIRNAAQRSLLEGRQAEAEARYREVLELCPQEHESLHMLGVICYNSNRRTEAFDYFLRALDAGDMPSQGLLDNLGRILQALFVGKTFGQAAKLRMAYARWKGSLTEGAPRNDPLVSIVMPAMVRAGDFERTCASVCAQTYRRIEIIVIGDVEGGDAMSALAGDLPFPLRTIAPSGASLFAQINLGVHEAAGEFVNILMPGDEFEAGRIERMVRDVVRKGGQWGFSGATGGTQGAPCGDDDPDSLATLREVRGADTTGWALLEHADLLASPSNLFFARALFDALGGFTEQEGAPEIDFALRALREAEPFFVDDLLLICRTGLPANEGAASLDARAQKALRGYYAQAAMAVAPANPFAPSLPAWGDHFIAHVVRLCKLPLLTAAGVRHCVARAAVLCASGTAAPERKPGLDLVGIFGGEIGLSESARGIARSCQAGGIPFAARPVVIPAPQGRGDHSMDPWLEDECSHAAVAFLLNPDILKEVLAQLKRSEVENRYRIGYWYWELARLPEQWRYALDFLDEIWVASDFVAEAVRRFTAKPVVKIRPPIEAPLHSPLGRADFGLDEERFLFLFSFDFGSFSARKNPGAVIRAFQRAFPAGQEQVGLVIKSHGGGRHPEKFRVLKELAARDGRIALFDRRMTRAEISGLQAACDAFVSLHRSEGLGLGLAECMALGKPVIATAYSGNLEFMHDGNSCLVDYRLKPIAPGEYLYPPAGVEWAEPDIDQAAACMRRLVADPDYRARIAAAGQEEMRTRWNCQATAAAIRSRLAELGLLD